MRHLRAVAVAGLLFGAAAIPSAEAVGVAPGSAAEHAATALEATPAAVEAGGRSRPFAYYGYPGYAADVGADPALGFIAVAVEASGSAEDQSHAGPSAYHGYPGYGPNIAAFAAGAAPGFFGVASAGDAVRR